jgi:ABC-2 type transport system permease protein
MSDRRAEITSLTEQAPSQAGVRTLLRPKLLSAVHRARSGKSSLERGLTLALTGVGGFVFLYYVSFRLLRTLRDVPELGPLLATKLLGLGLLLFLGILLLSNLIAALSSFFLAKDLPTVIASPADWLPVYGARLTETLLSSSWMVLLMLAPVLVAYERVYDSGLPFYAMALLALLPFLVIPAAVGAAITLVLVNIFPARRTRDLLGLVSVAAAALLVLAIRIVRPERLVNPEGVRNRVDFLEVLRGPSSPWLPSEWAAELLTGSLEGGFDPFWLLLLWSTATAFVVLGAMVHRWLYPRGYTRAQEGAESGTRGGRLWDLVSSALRPLGLQRRQLVLKDTRVFFRDATQWSQLLVLGVLLVVYVYNIQVLPIRTSAALSRFLVSMVVFLNLALAGFVLAAVAARFVFPSFSLEGGTLWLLRSSPLRPEVLVWSKYWSGAIPLLGLAATLTLVTNAILHVQGGLMVLALVTIGTLTLAIVAQALAWGIAFPKFDTENAAQIPTSLGGLLFMLGSLGTLAAVLIAQFWSLRAYLRSGLPGGVPRAPTLGEVSVALLLTLLLCAVGSVVPYVYARRRVARLDV